PGAVRVAAAPPRRRADRGRGGTRLRDEPTDVLPPGQGLPGGRAHRSAATEARPEGRPQGHRRDPRLRRRTPHGAPRALDSRVAPGCLSRVRGEDAPAHAGARVGAPGKRAPGPVGPIAPAPCRPDPVDRYEALGAEALLGPPHPSYGHAL